MKIFIITDKTNRLYRRLNTTAVCHSKLVRDVIYEHRPDYVFVDVKSDVTGDLDDILFHLNKDITIKSIEFFNKKR